MEYSISASLKEKVHRGQREKFTVRELKDKITQSWREIDIIEIQRSISVWKKRLRLVCEQDGGPIDHLLG